MTVQLRPYQTDAIEAVRGEMRKGHLRVVLVAPTGSGKTVIGSEVARAANAKGSRVLWLAHRTELVNQSCCALERLGLDVGAVAADAAWQPRPEALVQVASIQTLLARNVRPPADLLIWDECHHASEAAEEWAKILEDYKDVRALGLTATPERGDGSGLAPLFTGLAVAATVRWLTEQGFLVPCEIARPDAVLEPGHIAQHPLAAYKQHAPGQQGFLFAPSVEEAERYAEEFTAAGIRTVCVHAKTKRDLRDAAIAAFRYGAVRLLSNVFVFTEGVDLPMASACILARGASTAGSYLQMVGRVLRTHPGKKRATLIDLRGISHIHGPPEDERVYSLDGRGISRAEAKCKVCGGLIVEYPCPQCGYAPEAGEGEDAHTEIDGVSVNKFQRKLQESPQQREETLERWIVAALMKGHNPKTACYRYKGCYGEWPPAFERCLARAELRANALQVHRGGRIA